MSDGALSSPPSFLLLKFVLVCEVFMPSSITFVSAFHISSSYPIAMREVSLPKHYLASFNTWIQLKKSMWTIFQLEALDTFTRHWTSLISQLEHGWPLTTPHPLRRNPHCEGLPQPMTLNDFITNHNELRPPRHDYQ